MTLPEPISSSLASIGAIVAVMAAVALLETAIPLRARGRWNTAHLGPNLALTFLTFATNAFFNTALVTGLARLQAEGFGLLHLVALPGWASCVIVLLVLDFSYYVAHVAMHKVALFWRFHRVHHSDPTVDVTTTIRQHPGEGILRYAFLAAFAIPLGASPAAFAVYRVASALSGLLEHGNLRVPPWLDAPLSLVFTWPSLHKVHHSRTARFTDTNYGNIVSWWDRLGSTFTPARHGRDVVYGLDGFDDPAQQTTAGLLGMPFSDARVSTLVQSARWPRR